MVWIGWTLRGTGHTTRTEATRWGALTLRLRAIDRHWHLLDVQRLLASTHYRQGAIASEAPPEVPLDVKIDRVVRERQLATAALGAATRRLEELGPRDPERDHLRAVSQRWRTVVGELTDELARLRTTEGVSERVGLDVSAGDLVDDLQPW